MHKLKKNSLPLGAAAGVLCAASVTLLICLLMAELIYHQRIPMNVLSWCATAAAGIGMMAGALTAAGLCHRRSLPAIGAAGGACLFILMVFRVASGIEGPFGVWFLRAAGAVLCGCGLGALMSIRQNRHKKRRRHR